MFKLKKTFLLAAGLSASLSANAAILEIGFVLDGSGSINPTEYQLQLDGYKNTFSSGTFYDDFIAPSVYDDVYFSAWQFSNNVVQEIGWTHINSNAAATTFGDQFNTTDMAQIGSTTNTGLAIDDVTNSLLTNAIGGGGSDRMLIDISTDGQPFISGQTQAQAEAAALLAAQGARANGVTVNALGVGNGIGVNFLEDLVGIGSGESNIGFYLTAASFDVFGDAIEAKIRRETRGEIPEPASLALFGMGALMLGALRRRKTKA